MKFGFDIQNSQKASEFLSTLSESFKEKYFGKGMYKKKSVTLQTNDNEVENIKDFKNNL